MCSNTIFLILFQKKAPKTFMRQLSCFLLQYILFGAVMCLLTFQSELLEEACCKNQYRSNNGHKKPAATTKTAVN